ncbi:MAG: porin [Rhodobacteraceae bacterium]|nr:porin [Paracoccaceae bacterium]MCY4327034.1 porin [Paracoccaceae bacterium]
MRKLSLLAAAAMVAGGSAFAMDGGGVSISGEANFGVKYNEANDTPTSNALAFHHEFDITFAASGTTDGGIGFGVEVTIDNTESVSATDAKVGISGGDIVLTSRAARNAAREDEATTYTFVVEEIVTDADTPAALSVAQWNQVLAGEDVTTDDGEAVETMSSGDYIVLTATVAGTDDEPTDLVTTVTAIGATENRFTTLNAVLDEGFASRNPVKADVTQAKSTVDNHAKVYISMDMHKLTIGSDLDAADKGIVPGIADLGFDGIGVDDVAEKVWGGTAADVIYNGSFGVASVAFSYGDNAGDAEWAAGFKFSVDPVTVSAGFDSDSAMTVGLGFKQGLIGMNAMFSTDSDREEDNSDLKETAMGVDMSYQMDEATKIVIAAAQYKADNASGADTKEDAIGVGFEHDLGGGAHLKAGAGSVDSNTVADLGITMKF